MSAEKCVQNPSLPDHIISVGPSIDWVMSVFFFLSKTACRLACNGDEIVEIKFHDVQKSDTVVKYNFNILRTITARHQTSIPLFTFCWPIRSYSSEFQDCRKYVIRKGLCYGNFGAIYFSEHLKTPTSHDSCFCVSFELSISCLPGRSLKHFTAVRVVAEAIEFSEMWHSRRLVCRNAFQCDPLSLCKTVWSFLFALLLALTHCAVLCRDFRFALLTAVIRVWHVPVLVLRRGLLLAFRPWE